MLSRLATVMVALSVSLLAAAPAGARESYVAFAPSAGSFPLAANGKAAPIVVDAGDPPGVVRVAGDLQAAGVGAWTTRCA